MIEHGKMMMTIDWIELNKGETVHVESSGLCSETKQEQAEMGKEKKQMEISTDVENKSTSSLNARQRKRPLLKRMISSPLQRTAHE